MPTTITVRDESTSGKTLNQIQFEIPNEQITVRELIRSRVFQEVKDVNAKRANQEAVDGRDAVQPTAAEIQLNGNSAPKTIDWRRQFDRAIDAYRRGQILILVDNQQTNWLDDEITLRPDTQISFLRLSVLAGG